ncbi:hypothetical protein N7G274_006629 [Stereocaulon virgatum]|uniref:Uncharacterized protein n=1 Tax=Stereocaulon virgatum TaxID=373712 RepID=A0ABR4A6G8_9LECA
MATTYQRLAFRSQRPPSISASTCKALRTAARVAESKSDVECALDSCASETLASGIVEARICLLWNSSCPAALMAASIRERNCSRALDRMEDPVSVHGSEYP